ncbi:hypothetical protein ACO1BR_44180, partial [Streptomyces sp. YGL11-2]
SVSPALLQITEPDGAFAYLAMVGRVINKPHTRAAIAVVAAAISLSACNAKTAGESGKPAPTTSASPATSSQPDAPPSPGTQQTQALVSALKAIDPALGKNKAWAITGAKTICADVQAGQADADLQQGAKLRFQGSTPGTMPTVTDDQARRIVDAVKTSFCH